MAGIGFPISGSGGSGDPDDWRSQAPLFAEIEKLMSWSGGPVNWDLARQVAVRTAADGDVAPTGDDRRAIADAVRLADLWLDEATDLAASSGDAQAWTRVGWIDATLPVWRQLIDPVAQQVVDGLGGALSGGLGEIAENGLPEELIEQLPPGMKDMLPSDPAALQAMLGPMMGMLGQVGGMLFGSQAGQALGALATEVLGGAAVGLPLSGTRALLPGNIAAFAAELEAADLDQVRLFLAIREAAARRLFDHVPWLRSALLGAVEEYARGITVDPEQLQRTAGELQGIDPSDPDALQRALGPDLFAHEDSPEQRKAMRRLEALLALVEGWVDTVVAAAAHDRLPAADALREALRRRRVSGGASEESFAALVGLTLRPRRLTEAATLWDGLTAARGVAGRDALWAHPDLLPTADDLDDPAAFVVPDGTGEDWVGDDPIAALEQLAADGDRGPVEGDDGGASERGSD